MNLKRLASAFALAGAMMAGAWLLMPASLYAFERSPADMVCVAKDGDVDGPLLGGAVDPTRITYTIVVQNTGSTAATNVVVTDQLPTGAVYIDALSTTSCADVGGGQVQCGLGSVTGVKSVTIVVDVIPGLDDIVNWARVSATNDSSAANNGGPGTSCEDVIPVVPPTPEATLVCLEKSVTPQSVKEGESTNVTYSVRVGYSTDGPDNATNVTIFDRLDMIGLGGVEFRGADVACEKGGSPLAVGDLLAEGDTFSCNIGSITPNTEATLNAVLRLLTPAVGDLYANQAYATADGGLDTSEVSACAAEVTVEEVGEDGCTPGYWRNHLEQWAATGYSPADIFDTVFGTSYFSPDITLLQAVNLGGGGVNKLARHGTAALLSAAHPDVDYPYSVAEVIALVQAGDADALAEANELGCPIN